MKFIKKILINNKTITRETILVNRGWVPHKQRDPKTRATGQIAKEVDVIGIVRTHETRPVFMPANTKDSNCFLYRYVE